jgi:hypothetical protein
MSRTHRSDAQLDDPAEEVLGLRVSPLRETEERQILGGRGEIGVVRSKRTFADRERAPQERLLLREPAEAVEVRREDREGGRDVRVVSPEGLLADRQDPPVASLQLVLRGRPRRTNGRCGLGRGARAGLTALPEGLEQGVTQRDRAKPEREIGEIESGDHVERYWTVTGRPRQAWPAQPILNSLAPATATDVLKIATYRF